MHYTVKCFYITEHLELKHIVTTILIDFTLLLFHSILISVRLSKHMINVVLVTVDYHMIQPILTTPISTSELDFFLILFYLLIVVQLCLIKDSHKNISNFLIIGTTNALDFYLLILFYASVAESQ